MATLPKRRLSSRILKVSMVAAAAGVLFFGVTVFLIEFKGGVQEARVKLLSDLDQLVVAMTKEVKRREGRVRLLAENPQAMSAAVHSLERTGNPELFFGTGVLHYEINHLARVQTGGDTRGDYTGLGRGSGQWELKVVDLNDPEAGAGILYESRAATNGNPLSIRVLWDIDVIAPSHESVRNHLCEGISITGEDGNVIWRGGSWSSPNERVSTSVATHDVSAGGRTWTIVSREIAVFSEPVWLHASAPESALRDYAWRMSRPILVRTLTLLAVGMMLVLMMVVWIRQAMRPLDEITQGVRRISQGGLDTVLDVSGDDEIAFLAETLNDMAHRLKVKEQSVAAHIELLREKNDELETLSQKLKEADRLKDHFLAVLSHELRTPLTAVLGYSELLNEGIYGPLTEKQRETVTYIHSNGSKLLAIMEDLLDIAKIRAGAIEINAEPFSIRELLAEIRKTIENTIRSKTDVRYEEDIEPSVDDRFNTDPVKLEQILTNLLANAAKFTDMGSVRLKVRTAGQGWVEFEVEDTGIGIAEQHLPKIFDPFVQLDASIRRRYGGTGLGLTISRSLSEKLGGHVRVESEVGRGSKFTVTIPRVYAAEPTQGSAGPAEPGLDARA